jgi:hypothetical protein
MARTYTARRPWVQHKQLTNFLPFEDSDTTERIRSWFCNQSLSRDTLAVKGEAGNGNTLACRRTRETSAQSEQK